MEKKKHAGGRPSKLPLVNLQKVERLALRGLTEEEIAIACDISPRSLADYKKNPEFLQALKPNKDKFDDGVEVALRHRAMGYTTEETHIAVYRGQVILTPILKHYPPEPTACAIWLHNRRPETWRRNHEGKGPENVEAIAEAMVKAAEMWWGKHDRS